MLQRTKLKKSITGIKNVMSHNARSKETKLVTITEMAEDQDVESLSAMCLWTGKTTD